MKHYSIILEALLASCLLFACTQKEEEIPVSSVTISQPTAEMIVGETVKLSAIISPSNATDKEVIWASSKQSVAIIDKSGLVTAIAEGTSNITATAGGKTGTSLVTVSKRVVEVSSIELNKTALSLVEGEEFTLVATVKPEDATDKSVTWTSSDSSVAKVDDGKITAIKEGTASVTAKAGNKSVSCTVSVSKKVVAVTEVILNNTSLSMVEGDEATLTATVKPDNATDKTVSWSSSDASVASVSVSGEVTAIKEGTCVITAKSGDQSAACTVVVKKKHIPATSIELNKVSLTLNKGLSEKLEAIVTPSNTTETVSWRSGDDAIAKVEQDGTVVAIAKGETEIIASIGDLKATCKISVIVPVESITLSQSSVKIGIGESIVLSATVTPADASVTTVVWSSENPQCATVDKNGKVSGLRKGTTKVIAAIGNVIAECVVEVEDDSNTEQIGDDNPEIDW